MTSSSTDTQAYIFFELAGTTYGIPSQAVQQMEMINHITPVPNASVFVEGVVFSRGQVIPAINLRTRFGLQKVPYNLRTRLIVISTDFSGTVHRTVGLIVDTAREFVTVSPQEIQPPPDGISGLSGKYLTGIVIREQRVILLINVNELLTAQESANLVSYTS